ncbi:FMN-binding protein [Anoxynatronum sibiricum]|uniref:FMN-binding protein n=1 Tax=Anoxynatronum sibiricum TaxID=210623 RepID=A0ABU9VNW6_9CLOT
MDKKQIVSAVVLVVLTVGLLFSFNAMGTNVSNVSADTANYEVTAEGYGGPIRLMVYVKGTEIVNIELLEQNETQNIGDKAIDEMITKILENQSADVDVHAGATVSSNAVIAAVSNALGEAGVTMGGSDAAHKDPTDENSTAYEAEGTLAVGSGYGGDIVLDVVMDGDKIADIKLLDQNETENLGDVAVDAMIKKILQSQSTDVDVESGATVSSQAVLTAVGTVTGQQISEAAAPQDPAAAYDLESYEPEGILVSGKGFQDRYDIFMDVIFTGNEITEIRVIEHKETKGFGDGALRVVPERIVNQQTTEVDVQTGATWTSNAAMKIVQQAVEHAGVNLAEREKGEVSAPTASSSGGGT